MKMIAMGLALALAMPAAAAAQTPSIRVATIADLGWLAGHWQTEPVQRPTGVVFTEEMWTTSEGGTMVGAGRSVGQGRTRSFEFLRIAPDAAGMLSYYAMPNGTGTPTAFRLRETTSNATSNEAIFENADHDYPQRIVYRRTGATLQATISLIDGSRAMSWTYVRPVVD